MAPDALDIVVPESQMTALHYAMQAEAAETEEEMGRAVESSVAVISALLASGSDVNAVDSNGHTALMLVCFVFAIV